MAEPDQIDFNTMAHALWGVVDGCLVTASGSTASTLGGLALVNGALVKVNGQSVTLAIGGALDRFDLIVVNQGGTLLSVRGDESVNPVYPDIPLDVTVLASVFVPIGTSSLSDNVIDKRKFISRSLLTKIDPSAMLVQNLNNTGNHFTVTGGGSMVWEDDTFLDRSGVGTLRIRNLLTVDDGISTGGPLTAETVTAAGKVQGSNLKQSTTMPSPTGLLPGTLFQNQTNGRLYIIQNGAWQELATLANSVPVGSVITCVQPKAAMIALGWVPLDGATITEDQYPSLFTIPGFGTITGTAPHRSMVLPNAEKRVLLTTWNSAPGGVGGPANNHINLSLAQMPNHDHDVAVVNGGGGPITITMQPSGQHVHTVVPGGEHIHWVVEHPHTHQGMNYFGQAAAVIGVAWGGRNKIDALFNDRNHTYSVEAIMDTMPAVGEVDVLSNGSLHGHTMELAPPHTHVVSATNAPVHGHVVNETAKGSGAAVDITPQYLNVYTYIRS
jgi:hypothetical protein